MKALARLIMSGLNQAALVAAVSLILSVILTPLSWISGAAIALVTLHLGPRRGVQTMAVASIGVLVFSWLAMGSPLPMISFMVLFWLPVWAAAVVLRQSVSLALALQLITGFGVLIVLLLQLAFPDVLQQLASQFTSSIEQVMQQSQAQADMSAIQPMLDLLRRYLAGILAIGLMLTVLVSLMLGRWWQSVLYNPGGLQQEFNQLRLGRSLAIISLVLMAVAAFTESDTAIMVALVIVTVYMIEGTALAHALVEIRQINKRWLYALYITMFFIPHVVILLVVFGLLDAWVDFRTRLAMN